MIKQPIVIMLHLSGDGTQIFTDLTETITASTGQTIEFYADDSFKKHLNQPDSAPFNYCVKVYEPSAASLAKIIKVTKECGKRSTDAILNMLQSDQTTRIMNLRIVIQTVGLCETKIFPAGDQVWYLPSTENIDAMGHEGNNEENTMNTNSGGIIVRPPE